MIYGTVNGQHLRITSTVTAADTYRMLVGRFSFSEEWRGLTKIAYFRHGEETYPFLLVRDAIPADAGLNLTAGDWEAAISGYKIRNIAELDEQTAPRLTTNIAALHVEETVAPGDEEFPVIPKTLGEQILAVAEAAAATAEDVKRRADEGEFDGEDGYSPVASVYRDDENESVTVAITDKDGTHAATVFDGKKGDKGDRGEKGERGETGARGEQGEKGADGRNGIDGKDGYSPSAKVERTSDGAIITITDKTGTTSAKVNDGQGGGSDVTKQTVKDWGFAEDNDLSAVAKSGSYDDLTNKPTIPEAVTDDHIKEVAETENIRAELAEKADKSEVYELKTIDNAVTVNGWALIGTGLCSAASDSCLVKYPVTAGQKLYLELSADNAGTYQWQTAVSVPAGGTNPNLVGTPVSGAVNGYVEVPDDATYLIVSQYISNTTNKVFQLSLNSLKDVQINGTSLVNNGVATIPIASSGLGVVWISGGGLKINSSSGWLYLQVATKTDINNRSNYYPIAGSNLDIAVKAAMADGKGAAWTEAEQLAAQERLGIISSEGVGF